MVNGLRLAVGGLALACATTFCGCANRPPRFTDIHLGSLNGVPSAELKGTIYRRDRNHYVLQSSTNLSGKSWRDSSVNTNIYSPKPQGYYQDYQFKVVEPCDVNGGSGFLRLKAIK